MYRPTIVAILSLLLLSAPAVAAVSQTPAIMDWFPTVLELCGFKQNADAPKVDGRNMTGVIADPKAASAHEVLHFAWARNWAVRRGDWKLIGTFDAKTNTMRHSLQNLAEANPAVKDHSSAQPEIVQELTALHETWEKELESK